MNAPRPFRPHGHLALDPSAFGMLFAMAEPPRVEVRADGIAVVSIRGPLMHHSDAWGCFDSYDAIKARVLEALDAKPRAIVLSIDSPGGLVSGCFDTAREIRAACAKAGVRLVSYVDGSTLSAAYALACAGERIYAPTTGSAGSIGVVTELVDVTAADERAGVTFRYAYSGARKVDGNPHAGISDATLGAAQAQVDYLAGVFFAHVAAARPGIAVEEVRALEAGTFNGRAALSAGLVDEIATLDEVLEQLSGDQSSTDRAGPETEETTMDPKVNPHAHAPAPAAAASKAAKDDAEYEAAIATIRKRAKAGDAAAKRMLAAELDEEGDAKGEGDAPPEKKDEGDAKGEGADDEKRDSEPPPAPSKGEDEKDEKMGAQALAAIRAMRAEREAEAKAAADQERTQLLASRPDLDEPTRKLLATAPIADVRDAVRTIPRRAAKPVHGAPSFTRPEGSGPGASTLPPEEAAALDAQMGIPGAVALPRMEGNRQVLPVMSRDAARAELERRRKAAEERTPR